MKKVVQLGLDEVADKIMGLEVGEGFDFAAMTSQLTLKPKPIEEMEESDLAYWYGAKVVDVFDQKTALIGYYGNPPVTAVSLDDDADYVIANIRDALKGFDIVDWGRGGCYAVEEETNVKDEIESKSHEYKAEIELSLERSKQYHILFESVPLTEDACLLREGEVVTETAEFSNGYSVETEVGGVTFDPEGDNTPYCNATLFDKDGNDVYRVGGGNIFGEWSFEDKQGNNYVLNVVDALEKERNQDKAVKKNKDTMER